MKLWRRLRCKHPSYPWEWEPLGGWRKEDVVLPALVAWQCPKCGKIR